MDDELTIPVKRNYGETLEDRLTENAYDQILPGRYLQRDEDGNIVETQEELFERVAKNVALAEIVYTDEDLGKWAEYLFHGIPEEKVEGGSVPLNEETVKYVKWEEIMPCLRKNGFDKAVGAAEKRAKEFEEMMSHQNFIPNTPTLINAGTEIQQLSACFVDSPADDMEDIHQTAKEAALIFQSGGGVGYDFGNLRPYGDAVGSTGGVASGPITFMNTLDQVCETVAQGGVRRGAQMGTMPVTHPDIIFFIHAKNRDVSLAKTLRLNDPDDPTYNSFGDAIEEAREIMERFSDENGQLDPAFRNAVEGHLSNFNISVTIDSAFMEALENGEEYDLINPRTGEQHVANEKTKEMYEWFGLGDEVEVGEPLSIPAEEIWDRIVEGAHQNGEPGVMYIDTVNEEHSFDTEEHPEYRMTTSNPCAEQNLMEYEACNLGHINLSTIVDEDRILWDEWTTEEDRRYFDYSEDESMVRDFLDHAIDWDEFSWRVEIGTRFLDNVVTMSDFPIDDIEECVRNNRKIGLGIMGLAQLYVQLGVEYGSPVANEIARQIMRDINHQSKVESHELAKERGSFNNWEDSKYADPTEYPEWFRKHVGANPQDYEGGLEVRNHNTTTIAPTGTTSMIGDTTGGCEPMYNVANFKNVTEDVQGDEMLVEFDSLFLAVLEENGIDVEAAKEEAEELMNANEFDGPHDLETVPEEIADLFVTTGDLDSKEHASVMCALQEGVDSSISKTLNAPFEATVEDAKETFEYVYENGGKSVTFYRDGSRNKQVLTTRKDNKKTEEEEDDEEEIGGEFEVDDPEAWDEEAATFEDFEPVGEAPPENAGELFNQTGKRERPDVTFGETHRVTTGYGTMYVTINEDHVGPVELFAEIGKSGGLVQSFTESIARMVSLSFQRGASVDEVIDQLENIRSPDVGWHNGQQISSIPDGIAYALSEYKEARDDGVGPTDYECTEPSDTSESKSESDSGQSEVVVCNDCQSTNVEMDGGCPICKDCGWTKCF